ncbi:hypothetical protein AVEN_72702-1, partial [Araneus ventricosus]
MNPERLEVCQATRRGNKALTCTKHGGSSAEPGFDRGTLWLRNRDLTTWSPRLSPNLE